MLEDPRILACITLWSHIEIKEEGDQNAACLLCNCV